MTKKVDTCTACGATYRHGSKPGPCPAPPVVYYAYNGDDSSYADTYDPLGLHFDAAAPGYIVQAVKKEAP